MGNTKTTVFDCVKSKNIDEFAEWIDKYLVADFSPWMKWWDDNYCKKCNTVTKKVSDYVESEFGWCEIHNKCKFFKDMSDIPDNKQIIKLWLESECEE